MSGGQQASNIFAAIDALKNGDRDTAVTLLEGELRDGPSSGERWKSIGKLAGRIGEIDLAIEAARRFAATSPPRLDRQLDYWSELAAVGRSDQALAEIEKLPEAQRNHPAILHFLGTIASETGDFEAAEAYYRSVIRQSRGAPQTWFALAMIKVFTADDPDLAAMERLRDRMNAADPATRARLLYGLAKARQDAGDADRAFALYSEGAALRRRSETWDPDALGRFADGLIANFSAEKMKSLAPSQARERRVIFVNGLPRSGTTLVEQILASHSQVRDGGEINLLRAALIPTLDFTFAGAMRYQNRARERPDPWGDIARAYLRMLEMRFRTRETVIDKTLSQSHLMGLLLHSLPQANVLWLRRDPRDTALSCFRNFFSSPIPWSWSLEDIARYFLIEDRLYAHWAGLFPDRILTIPYENLAREPDEWIPKILSHAELPDEPQVREFHQARRAVRTASVRQVRAPISPTAIGQAQAYSGQMKRFDAIYFG